MSRNGARALEARDVVKDYRLGGRIVRALDGVSFAIQSGVLAAIVGPSGSGKTTLLNLLGALDVPTSGEVIVQGVALRGLAEAQLTLFRRNRVGFVFQRFNLIPTLTALENVLLPMRFHRLARDERRPRAARLLALVGMEHRLDRYPGQLSGGEQQRVAIARSLANDPVLVLADEPTGNLDRASGREVVELLRDLAHERGKTVIVVTHAPAVAEMADLGLPLRDGRILT